MPTKDNNIIKYNRGEKSIKMPFTIYVNLECLLEKEIRAKMILINHIPPK